MGGRGPLGKLPELGRRRRRREPTAGKPPLSGKRGRDCEAALRESGEGACSKEFGKFRGVAEGAKIAGPFCTKWEGA